MGGTYAWSVLPWLPLAFCFFYLRVLRKKDFATKEGILTCGAAMFLMFYLVPIFMREPRGEPHPLIPSWIFQLVLVTVFASLIVSFILPYMGATEKARKIRLAMIGILVAVMILDNPLDLPYIICVILVNSLFTVAAIRGPEPIVTSNKP